MAANIFTHMCKTLLFHVSLCYCRTVLVFNYFFSSVPLGVQLPNENKFDEMANIMESLQTYVPMQKQTGTMSLQNGNNLEFDESKTFTLLFGGDQLTAACARGAAVS